MGYCQLELFLACLDASLSQETAVTGRSGDYLCSIGDHRKIYFLWRPMLRDPHDDFVLELAVEAQVDAIVTYNVRDFGLARTFGLDVLTPQQFLRRLEVKK